MTANEMPSQAEQVREVENYGRALMSTTGDTPYDTVFRDAGDSIVELAEALREALHDRDRFERDAAWWRERAEGGKWLGNDWVRFVKSEAEAVISGEGPTSLADMYSVEATLALDAAVAALPQEQLDGPSCSRTNEGETYTTLVTGYWRDERYPGRAGTFLPCSLPQVAVEAYMADLRLFVAGSKTIVWRTRPKLEKRLGGSWAVWSRLVTRN